MLPGINPLPILIFAAIGVASVLAGLGWIGFHIIAAVVHYVI